VAQSPIEPGGSQLPGTLPGRLPLASLELLRHSRRQVPKPYGYATQRALTRPDMIDSPDHEVLVFNAAVQLSAADRAAFLETECGGDAELMRRVELLLQAHERAGAFLTDSSRRMAPASSGDGVTAPAEARIETSGAHVGRYKLMQQIGAGGCGVVY